jgi:hypothetical protein
MSISSTGLCGSATIVNSDLWHASSSSYTARATVVNSDLFNDVEGLKEQETALSTSYLTNTQDHRNDISQTR